MKDGEFAKAPEIASQRALGARRMTPEAAGASRCGCWSAVPIAVFSVWALVDNARALSS